MVSFKELHEADFSGVSEAAEAWVGVARTLTALDGRVTKDLTGTAQRAGWQGAAADEATKTLQAIDGDFKQASAVATALAAIMKTAAADFAAARRDLDSALHDAQADDLTVSADGTVSWSLPKGSKNDPDSKTKGEDLWGPDWSLKAGAGDPLGSLMKQMKSDPAAAQEFLDPSRNKNLTYLLKDRSWPNQDLEGKLSAD